VILAKAPLRVSFFGGGSDIPAHFAQWGGATISTAIDKYVYVAVMHTPHDHIKVSYSKQECVENVEDLERYCQERFEILRYQIQHRDHIIRRHPYDRQRSRWIVCFYLCLD